MTDLRSAEGGTILFGPALVPCDTGSGASVVAVIRGPDRRYISEIDGRRSLVSAEEAAALRWKWA